MDKPKKTTSQKKIFANQSNSKKSTGPTSPRGKQRSRGNPLKHGFFAKVVLPGESEAEYQALLRTLLDEDKPVGVEELMLVHQKARAHFFIQRTLKVENRLLTDCIYARVNLTNSQTEESDNLLNRDVMVHEDDAIGILMEHLKNEFYPRIDDILERFLTRLQTLDSRLEYLQEKRQLKGGEQSDS